VLAQTVQTVARVTSLQLYDDQPVTQQHADERVLAREEHVGVAEDAVLEDEQHPQHEERRVLHHDRDYDPAHGWEGNRGHADGHYWQPRPGVMEIMMPYTSGVQHPCCFPAAGCVTLRFRTPDLSFRSFALYSAELVLLDLVVLGLVSTERCLEKNHLQNARFVSTEA